MTTTSTIRWPDFMPDFQEAGYGYDDQSHTLRTDFESGPARVRQQFTCVPSFFPVTLKLSQQQMRFFEGFYKHALSMGTRWFVIKLLTGAGFEDHDVRFVGSLKPRLYKSRYWIINAQLEVEERNTISDEDTAITMYGEDALEQWADMLSGITGNYQDAY